MAKNNETAAVELKVPTAVLDIAKSVKKEFKIGEGGVVQVGDDFYERNLPEGLTLADVRRIQDHNTNIIAGVGLALGEVGLDHFKKNKAAEALSVQFKAGKDTIDLEFRRARNVPDGQGGQREKLGVLSGSYEVNGAGNRGSFKKVREHLAAQALAALG